MAVSPADLMSGLAINAQDLDRLRAQARQAPEQVLKQAAQQFEAVFMGMMLQAMREATPQDGPFDSEQTRMFTSMLDQQLAQTMASRGVGLADIMVRQLGRASAPEGPPAASSEMQKDFLQRMAPHAVQASLETGVPTRLVLAQAALESGWGRREILLPDGSTSHNLFGIKAGSGWNGRVAEVTTTEYRHGIPVKQDEKFRAYASYAEAFADYARLLRDNPRYAEVILPGRGAEEAAYALQRAGYATDPDYAAKLVKVMHGMETLG